mmetsp:Transcript_27043/g.58881  ORF Transcript_27043/g.58881 Transcript_27043/m.58881 type:complete len:153 (+) Transcript_27043:345-803(+)
MHVLTMPTMMVMVVRGLLAATRACAMRRQMCKQTASTASWTHGCTLPQQICPPQVFASDGPPKHVLHGCSCRSSPLSKRKFVGEQLWIHPSSSWRQRALHEREVADAAWNPRPRMMSDMSARVCRVALEKIEATTGLAGYLPGPLFALGIVF